MSPEPFRLLDLPQELQNRIYERYFEDARLHFDHDSIALKQDSEWPDIDPDSDSVEIDVDDLAGPPLFKLDKTRFPSLAIERVSHKVYQDSRIARNKVVDRKLLVDFGKTSLKDQVTLFCDLGSGDHFKWIYSHITELELHFAFLDGFRGPPWQFIVDSFPSISVLTVRDVAVGRIIIDPSRAAAYAASVVENSRDQASAVQCLYSGIASLRKVLAASYRDTYCQLNYRREWRLNIHPHPGRNLLPYLFWNVELHFAAEKIELVENSTNVNDFV